MCRHLRTSIVLLALFVFQLYVFGLDIGNEDDETMSLEPLYDRMTRHQTIKRVPTNYRGKLGVRWRRQNDRGARLKKMSSAHQNGPPLPEGLSRDPSESEFPFEAIYLNSNNSNSLYRSKEKHNKIGKNYRSWTEAESREVQSTETKNVVVKSRESVSVETNSRETEKSSEKLDDAELLNCEGLELCSSEVPSVNTTKRGLPDSTNRTELGSKEKIIANEPSSKRKERFFPNVLRDKNVSVTEVPPIGRHRGSIVPPFLTTESAVSRRPDDGSSLSPKKRRLSTTVPTSVSTEAFPQTMSYSIYNHFRPIDQEVPQEAIMPFLDFGRKLHQNAPSPSGVNSLEASTEHKTRTRHSSTTSRSEDDRLHDEMDVTLDRKTVERNNVPKVRVRSRGSSIAGLFRKAASASTVPTVRRTEPIDCTKVLRRRTLQNTDEYKLCLSTTENTVDNEASTDAHLENRPSNHKYSDEHEPPFVSQPKSNINSGVNYEIVNINNSSKSSLDDTSRLFHYEVEPSSSDTSNASEVTAGSEIATRVTTQTTSSGVPKRSTSLGDISSVTSSSRARADWTKVASGNRSPVATERSFGIENEGDSAKKSSFYSPVTRRFPTSQEQHAIDDEHTQRSYLDSSLLRTTFQQSPEVRTRLTSPTYQRSYPREESPRSTTHSVPILPRSEASSEFFSDTHRSKSEISSTSVRKPTYRTSTSTDRVAVDEVTESPEENVSSTQTTRDASSPPSTQENSTLPQYFFKEGTSFEPRTSEPKTIEPNTPTVPIWTRPATTSIPSTTPNYEIPGRNSSVRSPLEEIGPIYPDGLGTITYVLAIIAMVPLILGAVVVARLILGYNKKKVFDGSEYSSEYNRSPLEINGLVTSSPMTTKLPRVPQHLGWEMEKTGGLTIIPTPSSKWEFPRDKLRLQTVLGQGNFGQVWKAEADDLSGHAGLTRLVAVKTVKEGAQSKEREDLLRELGIMQDLGSHPNVVQLLGCCTEKEPYLLIMEYVMYGKLLSFLRDQRTRAQYYNFSDNGENLSSRDLTVFAYCVARGMDYLVSKGIIHRDLAARNVLVDHNKLCKIADFGMSRNVRDTGQIYEQRHSRGALPIRWMAPESLHYCLFTQKTDVWSFGVLVWEIVTLGLTPYSTMEARDVMRKIRNGYRLERPAHCRSELYQVMVDCWRANPVDRPTFAELKKSLCALLENVEYEGNYVDLESLADEMHRQG